MITIGHYSTGRPYRLDNIGLWAAPAGWRVLLELYPRACCAQRCRLLLVLCGAVIGPLLYSPAVAAEPVRAVVYPVRSQADDARSHYPLALLQLALEKSGGRFRLEPRGEYLEQGRVLSELASRRGIDVAWYMTSAKREAELMPVRFPIYKGLIGVRLLLINSNDEEAFSGIRNLNDLRVLTAGQGHDWPDRMILQHNGLRVTGVVKYDGLFRMLIARRLNYVPRSVLEIWAEAELYQPLGLRVAPGLALCYPATAYFFVSRDNPELAAYIETGLQRAQADGSFDRLFHSHYGAALDRAAISQRRVLRLHNPLVSEPPPALPDICSEKQNNLPRR